MVIVTTSSALLLYLTHNTLFLAVSQPRPHNPPTRVIPDPTHLFQEERSMNTYWNAGSVYQIDVPDSKYSESLFSRLNSGWRHLRRWAVAHRTHSLSNAGARAPTAGLACGLAEARAGSNSFRARCSSRVCARSQKHAFDLSSLLEEGILCYIMWHAKMLRL